MEKITSPEWWRDVELVMERAWKEKRGILFEHEVYEILGYMGIKVPSHVIVRNDDHTLAKILPSFVSKRQTNSIFPNKKRYVMMCKKIQGEHHDKYRPSDRT